MAHPQRHVRVGMLMRAKEALVEASLCLRVAGDDGTDCLVGAMIYKVSQTLSREGIDGDHQKGTEWSAWANPDLYDAEGDSVPLSEILQRQQKSAGGGAKGTAS